ncbi:hypothetical protein HGRIS_011670 [Hohenbuehelia grisea]|uniref:Flavin-containing monooxygenase n=1 Tax=Hohenbuehelia grisea TaxID=104357 RepID=A0ABR3JWT6_9AGAR
MPRASISSHTFDLALLLWMCAGTRPSTDGQWKVPRYPEIPGVETWLSSGHAMHSAWYRSPSEIGSAKSVLVVGAGPSGSDISAELRGRVKSVLHSVPGSTNQEGRSFSVKPRVVRLGPHGTVEFADGSMEYDVDLCIFATGYQFAFPFLSEAQLPTCVSPDSLELRRSTYHVYPLAMHIFPVSSEFPSTSLAFMGLLLRGTPLSLFEAQAHALVKVFQTPDSLDVARETEDILGRRRHLSTQFDVTGDPSAVAREWHRYTEHESFVYRDRLYEFAGWDRRVEAWEKEMWERKVELRDKWRKLVASGQSESWLDGVGISGRTEWVELLQRVLSMTDVAMR